MSWHRSSQRALLLLAAALLAVAALRLARGPAPLFAPAADDPRLDLRIDLNRAGAGELAALPGIGPALAGRIVAHRQAHGPFRSVDDLAAVPGLGAKTVDALRNLVAFENPP